MAGFWICFGDQATSISDRCGARQGAGKDGMRVFGLAAGKKKLPLTELGKTAHGAHTWQRAVGVETGAGFRRVTFKMAIKHPRGNAKQSDE